MTNKLDGLPPRDALMRRSQGELAHIRVKMRNLRVNTAHALSDANGGAMFQRPAHSARDRERIKHLMSGNIPLSEPPRAALSPLTALIRSLTEHGFPATKVPAPAELGPAAEVRVKPDDVERTKASVPLSDAAARPQDTPRHDVPAIPAFAYFFDDEAAIVPADSRLVEFFPAGDARPQAVRVVERSACKVKWYAVESWHANIERWIDRDVAPKKADALEKARAMAWLVTEEVVEVPETVEANR